VARSVTDDDRNGNIVISKRDRVGTISDVSDDRTTVERNHDRDLTDRFGNILGRGGDDSHEIRNEQIDGADDNGVRPRRFE